MGSIPLSATIDDAPITSFFTERQQKHLFIVDEWKGLDDRTARSIIEHLNGHCKD